jgi:hypothetical protein
VTIPAQIDVMHIARPSQQARMKLPIQANTAAIQLKMLSQHARITFPILDADSLSVNEIDHCDFSESILRHPDQTLIQFVVLLSSGFHQACNFM